MKSLIIALLIVGYSLNTIAQTIIQKDTTCSFLKNIKFKNGTDTVIIKATLVDITPAPPPIIDLKNPGRRINKYKFNSELWFQPENCTEKYYAPLKDSAYDETILNASGLGKIIYVTCVVFKEKTYRQGWPDFMAIKVAAKKAHKFK
jgi:hypothetical protein